MKKISLAALVIIFSLACNAASALNLDKLIKSVDEASNQKDGKKKSSLVIDGGLGSLADKLEEKINKVTDKLEKRLDKYEEKIDKAEKATDKVVKLVESLDASQIAKYIAVAKTAAFIAAALFGFFILLLILVFVQLLKVNKALKKA